MAQTARTELKSELGDTVGDFDFADLNPRAFVRKHLLDDIDARPAQPTRRRPGRRGRRLEAELRRPAQRPTTSTPPDSIERPRGCAPAAAIAARRR